MNPLHLVKPATDGHMYGTLEYSNGAWWMEAEPRVLQVAKRTLPGCSGRRSQGDKLRFVATARSFEDLNWLMLRFPMKIKSQEQYQADLNRSLQLASRRDASRELPELEATTRFKGELRPYQAEGVQFLIHNRRTLLADWVGLGKTVMAMGALAQANAWPAVVVAPANVLHQWEEHAETFLDIQGFNLLNKQAVILKGQKVYEPDPAPIYILHYGLLQYWWRALDAMGVRVVVYDEVQDLRHTGTMKYTAASNLSVAAEYVWGLSATPIFNYGGEIHSVLSALEYLCLDDYGSFSKEWCDAYDSKKVMRPDILGAHLRREGLMLRRVKTDVDMQLPPIRRAVTRIDHDEDAYQSAIAGVMELAANYNQITDYVTKGRAKRKILAASRHAAGVAKAPYAAAFIEALLAAGEKVLVFSWHHDVHDYIYERISRNHQVVRLTGRQTPAEKGAAQEAFAEGRADAIMLSHRTSAGLNGLQKHGTCVVFPELDWSPATHAQCEGRLCRDGVKLDSVLCYYLVASTGYDETMQEALGLKVEQIQGILGEVSESNSAKDVGAEDVKAHLDAIVNRLSGEVKKGRFKTDPPS